MIIEKCGICGKPVKVYPSELGRGHFCSRRCSRMAHSVRMKGTIPWNKGKTGVYSDERLIQMSKINKGRWSGDKNGNWKGDSVGYSDLHQWVKRHLGKAKCCEYCRTLVAKRYEWANKSQEYKRDLEDWIQLCTVCHANYDKRWLKRQRTVEGKFI